MDLCPVMTELAKNLILSGINLLIYDKNDIGDNLVNQQDIGNNFFLSEEDLKISRREVIKERLSQINLLVNITFLDSLQEISHGVCNCLVQTFTSFQNLVKNYLFNKSIGNT
jgi:molybdopterin/thiamine biosynthesis adenylyltransferase